MAALLKQHLRAQWLAQTISAGFGPLGVYEHLMNPGRMNHLPRLLGDQQAATGALTDY